MGRISPKLQPPIAPPNLLDLVQELSVLFGNNSPEALGTNSIENESIVR